jgi:hypothetical protein
LLAVGTVTGMTLQPLKQTASHVVLYRVVNGDRLQLMHRTTIDDGPVLALAHFQGRLLVGIGKTLRLYEMGKRQLLRKCELRGLPTFVKTLQTAGPTTLAEVLLYHVVAGETFSSALSDGDRIITELDFQSLSGAISDGTVTINGVATVGPADVVALNGVIHVIDTVLLPPGFSLDLPLVDLVDTAVAAGFNTLTLSTGAMWQPLVPAQLADQEKARMEALSASSSVYGRA